MIRVVFIKQKGTQKSSQKNKHRKKWNCFEKKGRLKLEKQAGSLERVK
jgi:hypothetical protein